MGMRLRLRHVAWALHSTCFLVCACSGDGSSNVLPAATGTLPWAGDIPSSSYYGDATTEDAGAPFAGGDTFSDGDAGRADAAPTVPDDGSDADADVQVAGDTSGDTTSVPPLPLSPCGPGACWQTAIQAPMCGASVSPEDFSTGKYNVHAYTTVAHAGLPLRLRLQRTGGDWLPALVVISAGGVVLSDGVTALSDDSVETVVLDDGGDGGEASVRITPAKDLPVTVYVTGWHVIDGGFLPAMPTAATYTLRARDLCDVSGELIAPAGVLEGETPAEEGPMTLPVGNSDWGPPVRVDAAATEHVGFRLDFSPSEAAVELEVLAWDGQAANSLGVTNEGPGLRVLAARDPSQSRTFWVRAQGSVGTGTLTVTRTPVDDNPPCTAQCGTLLQLPLPIDAPLQGYDMPPGVVYRYQFGRRDVLTAVFHAGQRMASLDYAPFTLKDLSKWDGNKPPGHETHTDGYHADISLYDASGQAVWKVLCAGTSSQCTGAPSNFGARAMALLVGAFFESGIVSSIYLDKVLIAALRTAADALLIDGLLTTEVHAIIHSDALRHVNYHHHHIHIRADGK